MSQPGQGNPVRAVGNPPNARAAAGSGRIANRPGNHPGSNAMPGGYAGGFGPTGSGGFGPSGSTSGYRSAVPAGAASADGGARAGRRGPDRESRTAGYLQENDPEALFGTDEKTVPPVIGG